MNSAWISGRARRQWLGSDRNPGKSQLTQDPGRAAAVVGGPKHPGPGRPAEDDAQRRPDPLTNAVSSYGPVPVSKQQVGRGYELTDGHLLEVTDEELRSVEIESSHTIEIDTFVPEQEIDKRYLQTPYYVAPTDRVGQEAFGVIRDAIKGANLAALGRVVLGRRERVIMLEPFERGLLGVTLRFPYEIRDPPPSLGTIADLDVPQEVHALAQHIVQSKTGHFEPEKFRDRYEEALADLLKRKQAGKPLALPPRSPRQGVAGLMEALKKSLEQTNSSPSSNRSGSAVKTRRHSAARRRSRQD